MNGFDNGAEALHVSSFLMEQYLEAADKVLDAAIVNGPKPRMIKKRFDIKDEKSSTPSREACYRHQIEKAISPVGRRSWDLPGRTSRFGRCGIPFDRLRGNYRFRISAYAFQTASPSPST